MVLYGLVMICVAPCGSVWLSVAGCCPVFPWACSLPACVLLRSGHGGHGIMGIVGVLLPHSRPGERDLDVGVKPGVGWANTQPG